MVNCFLAFMTVYVCVSVCVLLTVCVDIGKSDPDNVFLLLRGGRI